MHRLHLVIVSVVVALAMSALPVADASARRSVLVLKANGHVLESGAPYVATMAPSYSLRRGLANGEGKRLLEEIGCGEFSEEGTLETKHRHEHLVRPVAQGVCRVRRRSRLVPQNDAIENHLSFSGLHAASSEAAVELGREEREITREEEEQYARGEEPHPRMPLRCVYQTARSTGTFPTNGSALVATIRGRATLAPRSSTRAAERPPSGRERSR